MEAGQRTFEAFAVRFSLRKKWTEIDRIDQRKWTEIEDVARQPLLDQIRSLEEQLNRSLQPVIRQCKFCGSQLINNECLVCGQVLSSANP